MPKYSFYEIREIMEKMLAAHIEPELRLFLNDKEYMIIGFENEYSFQRCGTDFSSGEYFFRTLEDLYRSETIDGIVLQRDWPKITGFECTDYEWYYGKNF
ncbi:MAG: hypothetical protein FWE11_05965 [Defluviitaleaceae bacterium]|nr:hypothetical protein [Defluviitaleaceae bacterium]